MLFYFLQTSLMLLVSYFLGCWLGCTLRNTIGSREPVPVRAGDARAEAPTPAVHAPVHAPVREPAIAPTTRAASATEPAFRRTDLQTPAQAPVQAPASIQTPPPPVPPVAVVPPIPPVRPVEVRPAPAPAVTVAPALTVAPAPVPVTPQPAAPAPTAPVAIVRPATVTGVSVTAAAAAAAAAAVAQGRARETAIGKPPADAILTPAASGERVSLPAAGASSGVSGVAVGGQARATTATGSDDLKRIRGIGPEIETALHRIGVRRFGEVAGWSAGDVDTISKTLGLKGRIEHENWIEQAQVLSKGGETAFSRRYDRGEMEIAQPPKVEAVPNVVAPAAVARAVAPALTPAAAPTMSGAVAPNPVAVTAAAVAAAAAVAQRVAPMVVAPAAASPDRVRELSGILSGAGKPATAPIVASVAQAVATPAASVSAPAVIAPVPAVGDDLTRIRGIDRDMARLLADRGITKFAQIGAWTIADADRFGSALSLKLGRVQQESWIDQARLLAGMGPAFVPAVQNADRAEGAGASWHQRAPNTEWTPEQKAAAAAAAQAAQNQAAQVQAAVQTQAPVAPAPVAPAPVAPTMAPQATMAVAAAAAAAASAVAAHAAPVVAAAAMVAAAPVPTPVTPAPIIPAAPAPAVSTGGGARVVRSGVPDDLKRIKGIGVVLEKKLHGLGIINYGQIAGWAQSDIDKMSDVLDFNGRIERENWIEQARILATGGITDFARRVDRGEVETGSPRPVR